MNHCNFVIIIIITGIQSEAIIHSHLCVTKGTLNFCIIIMNAQECRTLTATCIHIAQCILLNIRSIELHVPNTLHLNRVLVLLTTHPAPKQGSGTSCSLQSQ